MFDLARGLGLASVSVGVAWGEGAARARCAVAQGAETLASRTICRPEKAKKKESKVLCFRGACVDSLSPHVCCRSQSFTKQI